MLVGLLFSATQAYGQTNDAWPPSDRHIADLASTVLVGTDIAADVVHAVQIGREHSQVWQALGCEGLKFGIANGAALTLKHFIHEARPDNSDNQSFPSEHTANAFAATGWAWQVSVPVAITTGYLRTAANRHWWRDVAAGAGIGLLSRYVASRLAVCKGVA